MQTLRSGLKVEPLWLVLAARKGLAAQDWADIFLKAMPKIQSLANTQPPPFIAKVARDGTVTLLK